MNRLLLALLLSTLLLHPAQASSRKSGCDLRVLVDVSGSMRHTDPDNLRAPAVRLFSQLMPPECRGGIWLFSGTTEPLVPLGPANTFWRANAVVGSTQIHARGQRTNIGDALESATGNWQHDNRSVILLTDGKVDVEARNAQANERARSHIIESLLPHLASQMVHLHTIGLSDQVDRELLSLISAGTDALYLPVASAEQLVPAFLRLFDQIVGRNQLPLAEGKFIVDASTEELLAIIFHGENAPVARLTDQSGKPIQQSDPKARVVVRQEPGFDLVTVRQPGTGTWQLSDGGKGDARIMISSRLQLEVADLPASAVTGQRLQFQATLWEGDRPLADPKLLDTLSVSVTPLDRTDARPTPLTRSGDLFTGEVSVGSDPGLLNFSIVATGPTFQREVRRSVRVIRSPVKARFEWAGGASTKHRVQFVVDQEAANVDSLRVEASVTLPNRSTVELPLSGTSGRLPDLEIEDRGMGEYSIHMTLSGRSPDGQVFRTRLPDIHAMRSAPHDAVAPPTALPTPAEPQGESAAPKMSPWLYGLAGLFNLGLIAGAVLLYRRMVRRDTTRLKARYLPQTSEA